MPFQTTAHNRYLFPTNQSFYCAIDNAVFDWSHYREQLCFHCQDNIASSLRDDQSNANVFPVQWFSCMLTNLSGKKNIKCSQFR